MTLSLWPSVTCGAELDALRGHDSWLQAGVTAIIERHGWALRSPDRDADGSLPVYSLADAMMLKLYPPPFHGDFVNESCVLEHLAGRLPCPRVVATGELEGWAYLAMTRLDGCSLAAAWPRIPRKQQLQVAEDIGHWLAELHALPLAGLAESHQRWTEFREARKRDTVAEQRSRGLGEPWLSQIAPYLECVVLKHDTTPVLLHTEVMRKHVFVKERDGRWRLSGLLDFEPSMPGAAEYELASVGIFTSCGDGEVLRRLLLAYGYESAGLDHDLQRRCMAYALLHRYAHLGWYLREMPPKTGVDDFDRLAAQWWSFQAT